MSVSLIKILSCSIFIAKQQNNKILSILLKDYAKTQVTQTQYIYIMMLVMCYEDNNIFKNDKFFRILDIYINIYGNHLCKFFLYNFDNDINPLLL
jgi:hypothetical protein